MAGETVQVTIDGKTVSVPRGLNLIEAAKLANVEVPHYCYHQKLKIAGNCRMCLVDVGMPKLGPDKKPEIGADGKPVIAFGPKLAIGCNTAVAEGMVVNTRTPKIIKQRQGVMEFLLINHPLDCPICDQAGECRLQEFAVDYGKGGSRFLEQKEHKPKRVPLGPKITLDDERCILCSRCVRFMKDVAGQDCLGFVQRGSRSVLTCYPGQEPNTNYDLNIVDLCPVGALTSNDFRFRQRVWFLKETRSVCSSCSTGCNTIVSSRDNVVYRQQPRDNADVNQCWMCDHGRLNYKFINSPERLMAASVRAAGSATRMPSSWADAAFQVGERLKLAKHQNSGIAAIGSARATMEELFLFHKLAKLALGATHCDCVPRTGKGDHFLLSEDRNPNSFGAHITGVSAPTMGSAIPEIAKGISDGRIKTLLVLGENVAKHGISEELLSKLDFLAVIDTLPSPATQLAHVTIPGMTFAEKRGTFINGKGRIQRLNAAIQVPGEIVPEWMTLASILAALGAGGYSTVDEVFLEMSRTIQALKGLSYAKIGDLGIDLKLADHPGGEVLAWAVH